MEMPDIIRCFPQKLVANMASLYRDLCLMKFILSRTDRHSIAYELHTKAIDILEGRRVDPTFYPVVYGLKDDEDWEYGAWRSSGVSLDGR